MGQDHSAAKKDDPLIADTTARSSQRGICTSTFSVESPSTRPPAAAAAQPHGMVQRVPSRAGSTRSSRSGSERIGRDRRRSSRSDAGSDSDTSDSSVGRRRIHRGQSREEKQAADSSARGPGGLMPLPEESPAPPPDESHRTSAAASTAAAAGAGGVAVAGGSMATAAHADHTTAEQAPPTSTGSGVDSSAPAKPQDHRIDIADADQAGADRDGVNGGETEMESMSSNGRGRGNRERKSKGHKTLAASGVVVVGGAAALASADKPTSAAAPANGPDPLAKDNASSAAPPPPPPPPPGRLDSIIVYLPGPLFTKQQKIIWYALHFVMFAAMVAFCIVQAIECAKAYKSPARRQRTEIIIAPRPYPSMLWCNLTPENSSNAFLTSACYVSGTRELGEDCIDPHTPLDLRDATFITSDDNCWLINYNPPNVLLSSDKAKTSRIDLTMIGMPNTTGGSPGNTANFALYFFDSQLDLKEANEDISSFDLLEAVADEAQVEFGSIGTVDITVEKLDRTESGNGISYKYNSDRYVVDGKAQEGVVPADEVVSLTKVKFQTLTMNVVEEYVSYTVLTMLGSVGGAISLLSGVLATLLVTVFHLPPTGPDAAKKAAEAAAKS